MVGGGGGWESGQTRQPPSPSDSLCVSVSVCVSPLPSQTIEQALCLIGVSWWQPGGREEEESNRSGGGRYQTPLSDLCVWIGREGGDSTPPQKTDSCLTSETAPKDRRRLTEPLTHTFLTHTLFSYYLTPGQPGLKCRRRKKGTQAVKYQMDVTRTQKNVGSVESAAV